MSAQRDGKLAGTDRAERERGNKDLVRALYDAGNRGDLDGCLERLADDVTWTNIGTTRFSGTFTGKDDVVENLLGPLFERLKAGIETTIERLIAEDDTVVAMTRGNAETRDGVPYRNRYCQVMRVRDGRIVEVVEYMDTELVSRTFGRTGE